jgi:hypothetical protein
MGHGLRLLLIVLAAEFGVTLGAEGVARADGACTSGSPGVTSTFTYTGSEQCYSVPAGTADVQIEATGAPGGEGRVPARPGGDGATVWANVAVPVGTSTLYVEVGGAGSIEDKTATFGGGGATTSGTGGSGGGASDVRTCSAATCALGTSDTRLVVAGGGGGGGGAGGDEGSSGGFDGSTGSGGGGSTGGHGGGGTQAAGGLGGSASSTAGGTTGVAGSLGLGGAGGFIDGGGGGGGYYGGGGGGGSEAAASPGPPGGGGGGGSSFGPVGAIFGTAAAGVGASVTITPYATSSQGLAGQGGTNGAQGPAGQDGTNGAQGPAGSRGPAGQIELVTCKSITVGKGKHKRSARKCTTKLTSSPVTITTTGAPVAAVLSRGDVVYATGSAISAGNDTALLLRPRHKLGKGSYTLTLTHGRKRRRETITIA